MNTLFSVHKAQLGGMSQWGEDGIIQEIFKNVPTESPECVEFGAADGMFCSNTWRLWRHLDWNANLYECNPKSFNDLTKNTEQYENVVIDFVAVEYLDNLIPYGVDLVSMDVDGLEYSILYNMEQRHKVLIIEHNPTFPPNMHFRGGDGQGSSALALCELAERKGYRFLTSTLTNLFFVAEEFFSPFEKYDTKLEHNFDPSSLNYVVTDYNGNYDIKGYFPYGMNDKTIYDVSTAVPEHICKYIARKEKFGSWALSQYSDISLDKS